jgi:hypothetical protein
MNELEKASIVEARNQLRSYCMSLVTPATGETEIRRTVVLGQPGQKLVRSHLNQ